LLRFLISFEIFETKVSSTNDFNGLSHISFAFDEGIEWFIDDKTKVAVLTFSLDVILVVFTVFDYPSLVLTIMFLPGNNVGSFLTFVVLDFQH
jgi:hypothetical protein